MGFLKKLFGGSSEEQPPKLSPNEVLKAITFAGPQRELLLDDKQEIYYRSTEEVSYLLHLDVAPDWPFDLTSIEGAKAFYGQRCAEAKGAVLFLDIATAGGAQVLRGIFNIGTRRILLP